MLKKDKMKRKKMSQIYLIWIIIFKKKKIDLTIKDDKNNNDEMKIVEKNKWW